MKPAFTMPASMQRRKRGAFTLIELLVVMTIIVIIVAISFPAYNKLTSGNARKEAVNAISMQVVAARSLAMQMQRQVGVVFYAEPTDKGRYYMVLVQAVQSTQYGTEFGQVPERNPVPLPRNIKVAGLSGASATASFTADTNSGGAASRLCMIVFSERGQPLIRNNLLAYAVDVDTNPRSARSVWNLAPAGAAAPDYGSMLAFSVYDVAEFEQATAGMSDAQKASWILTYTDIISVHPYTGTVIR